MAFLAREIHNYKLIFIFNLQLNLTVIIENNTDIETHDSLLHKNCYKNKTKIDFSTLTNITSKSVTDILVVLPHCVWSRNKIVRFMLVIVLYLVSVSFSDPPSLTITEMGERHIRPYPNR